MIRDQVYQFYRDVFPSQETPSALEVTHAKLRHPVVTPHFLNQTATPPLFYPWLNVLGEVPQWLEDDTHYRRTLTGQFIRFSQTKPPSPHPVHLRFTLPPQKSTEYRAKACANISSMEPGMLEQIEDALRTTQGRFTRIVATGPDEEIIGGLNTLEGNTQTLMVLGWVAKEHRRRGVMGEMMNAVLDRNPQRGVIAWTFNPILAEEGTDRVAYSIWERT